MEVNLIAAAECLVASFFCISSVLTTARRSSKTLLVQWELLRVFCMPWPACWPKNG